MPPTLLPLYVAEPYTSALSAHLAGEEAGWDSDRDWTDLLDALIAERKAQTNGAER